MNDTLLKLQEQFGDKVKSNFVLAPYTTFKMGGAAEFYMVVETKEEMQKAYQIAKELQIPFFVFGGASNIVISEQGLKGLVVRNLISYKKIIQETGEDILLEVGSGYPITRLSKETAEEGLSGVEFHLGLPGSVGGSVYMNSKWTHPKAYIGDAVESVQLINHSGELETRRKEQLDFRYGWSNLQETKEVVVSVTFKLKKIDSEITKKNAQDALAYRKETQPFGVSSSGCFFKNDGDESAGKLIDEAGLKGFQLGSFVISDKHANFIINKGNGKESDLKKLLRIMKEKVKEKFGVELKEEVIIM